MNKAFANSLRGEFGLQEKGTGDVPYAMLKAARHSGQLNLSNRNLEVVPVKVWKINLDVPEEAKNVALGDNDERWWDQVDLKKLILASNLLTEIPDNIQYLPALAVLDAHDNHIEHLSEELGNLRDIYKLHLSHNKISKFPTSFVNLSQLKCLLLTSNSIEQLPNDFGSLWNLEELQLAENNLTTLPDSIGKLKQLRKLNLSKNQIATLPNTFHNLMSLVDLDLSCNKLASLPEGLSKLTSLSILECRNNQIEKFTSFDEPSNIQQLFLGVNKIVELDNDAFDKLPQLVSLDLRDNRISVMPESIINSKSVERIDLSNNFISSLPYAMGNMSLKSLSLDGNPLRGIRRDIVSRGTQAILTYLKSRIPEPDNSNVQSNTQTSISTHSTDKLIENRNDVYNNNNVEEHDEPYQRKHAPKEASKEVIDSYLVATTKVLQHSSGASLIPDNVWLPGAKINKIDFSKNSIKQFPVRIGEYSDSLSELDLSKNKLTLLPPLIGSLMKLTYLDVSNNSLTAIPVEINQLVHLLQLTLTHNHFTKIPGELTTCPKLQVLLLSNNQISEIDVAGLLRMKTLHCLDLANNDIGRIPPELGNVSWLKSLTLDGNRFRNPRPQIMTKGTQYILEYLRDRIPT